VFSGAAPRQARLKDYRRPGGMTGGIRAGELNRGVDSMKAEDLKGSSSFAGNTWNIRVIKVNGEIGLAKVKLSAWTTLNDKAWQVWKNVKGSSYLPYIG